MRRLLCYRGEMQKRAWGRHTLRAALSAVAVAALAAACGGQDAQQHPPTPTHEGASAPGASTATPERQAVGGGRSEAARGVTEEVTAQPSPASDQSAAATPDSAEQQYLRDVCAANEAGAHRVVVTGTSQRVSDSVDEPGGYERLNIEPLRRLVDALRSISPPDELAMYHDSAVANYEELLGVYESELELIESGEATVDEHSPQFGAYAAGGPRGPSLPLSPQIRDRLGEAATNVPECSDAQSFLFFFLGVHLGGPAVTGGPVDPADEAFVRSLCIAGNSFAAAVDEAATALARASEIDETDVEAYIVVALEAYGRLVADLRENLPPDDVADYHAAFVDRIDEGIALLDIEGAVALLHRILQSTNGNEEATLEDLSRLEPQQEPLTPLSPATREQLSLAMLNVIECYHNLLLYEYLGVLDDPLNGDGEGEPPATGTEIPVGASLETTLDTPEEEDTYWFRAEEGRTYLVATVWEASRSALVHVEIDGGSRGTSGAGNMQPLRLKWAATESGAVTVRVHSAETARGPVSYTISVMHHAVPRMPRNTRYSMDGSGIQITWDAVDDANYYRVFQSDDSYCSLGQDGSPAFCDELATNVADTTYLHTRPDGDENYYWVAACNSEGCSSIDSHNPAEASETTSR